MGEGAKRRISCELPSGLVDRLEEQAILMEVPRQQIIEAAVEGVVRQFEEIDDEVGRRCTCGADGSRIERQHLPSCLKRPARAKEPPVGDRSGISWTDDGR